jgi:hypothetical protein
MAHNESRTNVPLHVLIVSTGAVVAPSPTGSGAGGPASVLADECNGFCMTTVEACPDDPWDTHRAQETSEMAIELNDEGAHNACWETPCWFWDEETGRHPYCDPEGFRSRVAFQALREAVEDGDLEEIKDLVDRSKGTYFINPERRSLQVAGCENGSVVANYPLSADQWTGFLDLY